MRSFRCEICQDIFPASLHHLHHKIPQSLGGPDTPDNLVNLCQADHQLLHTIAFMMVNSKRKHEIEPTLVSMYANNIPTQKKVIEYASYVAREMALKKEIKKDPNEETRITVELPQVYVQLLKLSGYDMPRKNGKPVGISSLLRVIIAEYLSKKFPMRRDEILALRVRKPSK